MIKKKADELVKEINHVKNYAEACLEKYLKEYADYGIDSTANNMMSVIAILEQTRLELQYALIKGEHEIY